MAIPDFTIVVGVDAGHILHFRSVFPNWLKNKPSTFEGRAVVVFYDGLGVDECPYFEDLSKIACIHPDVLFMPWPQRGVRYENDPTSRFGKAQRYKMLSGFVHVPASVVDTKYWLKLDLDTVATGQDNWIDEKWFDGDPAIISSSWSYTKPADQMVKLDEWVAKYRNTLSSVSDFPPLNLRPRPGSSLVKHQRIISWCSFFRTDFTQFCSSSAQMTCGSGKLPVPSQDGYMWYLAKRLGLGIVTPRMKSLGWDHCSGLSAVRDALKKCQTV